MQQEVDAFYIVAGVSLGDQGMGSEGLQEAGRSPCGSRGVVRPGRGAPCQSLRWGPLEHPGTPRRPCGWSRVGVAVRPHQGGPQRSL